MRIVTKILPIFSPKIAVNQGVETDLVDFINKINLFTKIP
ncbi:hypothetical protein EU92_1223 [Prochlorococcus marinus str. MIT 9107]|uniref:Uncharacterized protein n=1 Tax=Prochlorococcus marinus str. MIT 9116 TaxID=167544 RepID=A0A0A1ZSP0_PROMR|nr:hypothetical protein EU92_1223 [Prochlorococcus marinus str. MIT 9107]KGF91294.1 hypothetical protein EU93_1235 [Prochlorococcus marinus str. MIT 9116]KGF94792.1 hypothetical protein EU94_0404 [Prochlorococcus marinus str. MIT 9123]